MSHISSQRKSTVKSNTRFVSSKKNSSNEPGVRFRWSTAARPILKKENSSLTIQNIKPISPSQRVSSISKSGNSSISHLSISSKQSSIDKHVHSKENQNRSFYPIVVTYAQLHRAQHPTKIKNRPLKAYPSIDFLFNDKDSSISDINSNLLSITNSGLSTNEHDSSEVTRYLRLRTAQLHRLHVSDKYIQEAKNLYFIPESRAFIPPVSVTPRD